ncbi:MAG: biotin carboxylase N-terminal domain-containing protein [Planctomycetota bacterium]|nr:biotin carboxylase N-terminal domain-containing protein [Planctomycetota bacterium]
MSAKKEIRKVLVANRGEIAIRVFQACRERGIETVSVHSEADKSAPHRFAADESVLIGPAAPSESYLRVDRLIDAAKKTGADAIHPGYGFLAENAPFARAVEEAGLIFIGPTPEQIESMGDKVQARAIMMAAEVPVIPGTKNPIEEEGELIKAAKDIGYPLLLKAAGGGGGKGIRRVDSDEELVPAWKRTRSEALASFGDDRVYIERLVQGARHIEAQIVGDGQGSVWFLGERECSLQRNHQKVLEESPSPAVDEQLRARFRDAAVSGAAALNYRGAGTMEFLYEEDRGEFYFLEMNTRLQVEHPVTELVTGIDLVGMQLDVAAGRVLEHDPDISIRGWSLEFRVCAEDPYRDFIPSTGQIRGLRIPHAPFCRLDGALREGLEVTPYYDPMLAKAIVWAEDRNMASRRLSSLLSRLRIGGIHTTVPLGIELCEQDWFLAGDFDTTTLEAWLKDKREGSSDPTNMEMIAAIIARHALGSSLSQSTPVDYSGGAWGKAARREGTGNQIS